MSDIERRAWAEQAMLLRARAGGLAAISRQERHNADRTLARNPAESAIHAASAEQLEAQAKVAGELAEIARLKAEDVYV